MFIISCSKEFKKENNVGFGVCFSFLYLFAFANHPPPAAGQAGGTLVFNILLQHVEKR